MPIPVKVIYPKLSDKDALIAELRAALRSSLGWIDAVPTDAPLPTMPGFDRDWAESLLTD